MTLLHAFSWTAKRMAPASVGVSCIGCACNACRRGANCDLLRAVRVGPGGCWAQPASAWNCGPGCLARSISKRLLEKQERTRNVATQQSEEVGLLASPLREARGSTCRRLRMVEVTEEEINASGVNRISPEKEIRVGVPWR